MYTIAGAPNAAIAEIIEVIPETTPYRQNRTIDILCSDYYPAAMLHSIFTMEEKYGMNLVDMMKLVTINPAIAVKMDHEIGSVCEGKKADLLIIEKLSDDFPVITAVFVDGKLIQKTNYRA